MAYKPTTNGNLIDDDFRLATSEAVVEGLKLKVDAPVSAGTASQILSLVNPTTGETSWIDNTGVGANTSLSNLSATAMNQVLRGLDGTAAAPAYSFTSDTNTGIFSSGADTLNFSTGGVERVRIDSSGRLLLGTDSFGTFSNTRLRVAGNNIATNADIAAFNNGANGAGIYLSHARGTQASPSASLNGDVVGFIGGRGYGATGFPAGSRASVNFVATNDWTDAGQGCSISFRVTGATSTTTAERMRLDPALLSILPGVVIGKSTQRSNFFGTTFTPFLQSEGTTNQNSSICLVDNQNANSIAWGFYFGKSRGTTVGSTSLVSDGDALGSICFTGSTSTSLRTAAYIQAFVQGTPSDTAMPGRLSFFTTTDGTLTSGERMRIDNRGVVLLGDLVQQLFTVGATRPRLIISGAETNSSSMGMVCTANSTLEPIIYFGKSRGVSTAANSGDALGSLNFQVFDGTNMRQAARIQALTVGTISATSAPGVLTFSTVPDGSLTQTERMRITSDGNVGINVNPSALSSPAKFTIAGTTTGGNVNSLLLYRSTAGVLDENALQWRSSSLNSASISDLIESSTAASMVFKTATSSTLTERMRITSAGNVGIGTTAPTNKLEVQVGTASLATALALSNHVNYASGRGVGISFRVPLDTPFTTSYAGGFIGSTSEGGSGVGNSNLIFQTASSQTLTERMRINNAGNVGIACSDPAARLDVLCGSNAQGLRLRGRTSDSIANISFQDTTNTTELAVISSRGTSTPELRFLCGAPSPQSGLHTFYTGGVERMRISSGGNVGIGTTTPAEKLTVDGNIQITGTARRIVADFTSPLGDRCSFVTSTTNGNTSIQALPNGTATLAAFTAYNNSNPANSATAQIIVTDAEASIRSNITGTGTYLPMTFLNGGQERMRITTGGEVYIAGTTDRGAYNLQCNGTGVWGAGAYVNGSDERIKEEINMLESGLDVVEKLNPVTYRYKKEWSKDQSVQTGFIAQELLTALEGKNYIDGIVQQGESNGYYSVAYQNITPILTKAIQELKQLVDQQAAKIAELEAKLNSNE